MASDTYSHARLWKCLRTLTRHTPLNPAAAPSERRIIICFIVGRLMQQAKWLPDTVFPRVATCLEGLTVLLDKCRQGDWLITWRAGVGCKSSGLTLIEVKSYMWSLCLVFSRCYSFLSCSCYDTVRILAAGRIRKIPWLSSQSATPFLWSQRISRGV